MNSYKATVTYSSAAGQREITTYVGARTAKQAIAQLKREGFTVVHLWVLDLSACK